MVQLCLILKEEVAKGSCDDVLSQVNTIQFLQFKVGEKVKKISEEEKRNNLFSRFKNLIPFLRKKAEKAPEEIVEVPEVQEKEKLKYRRMFPLSEDDEKFRLEVEGMFDALMKSLKIPCEESTDFEDVELGIDYWLEYKGRKDIPVDIFVLISEEDKAQKIRDAKKRKVLPLHFPYHVLKKAYNVEMDLETIDKFQEFQRQFENKMEGGLKEKFITRRRARQKEEVFGPILMQGKDVNFNSLETEEDV